MSAAAILWSVIVALTGGFYFRIFGWRVSSRDYRDALVIGSLIALTAIGLTWWVGGWQTLRTEWLWLARRVAPITRRVVAITRRVAAITAGVRRRISPRFTVVPALAIALAGIALDIFQWANAPPLWFDEEAILLNVRDRSWSDLGGSLWLGQSAPLGWLVAERAALVTFGTGELALRLVPLVFGMASIAVALWIGLRWIGPLGSAVLVLLFTFGTSVSHYTFEAKHYSADTFWATLLPALAVWAAEGDGVMTRVRRSIGWWVAAACGQMLANGALLVAPGCAVFLAASLFRRDGRRAALLFLLAGVVWLAAFGLHYELSLRATHTSTYLRNYWSNEIPPAWMGLLDRARWIGARFEALARDPVGTDWWQALWICAPLGLALGGRRALGVVFATAPLSAFILSGAGIMPLYQRLVLWIAPAVYLGLAMAIDRAAGIVRDAARRRLWAPAVLATLLLVAAGAVCLDIYSLGKHEIKERMADEKHLLDDRAAGRWLMARLRPGDAILTTRLAWAAIWWYGGISIANADPDGVVRHPDGVALLEIEYEGAGCEDRFREDLRSYRRVLVYVGFDPPRRFDLLGTVDKLGTREAFGGFSARGRAAVVDLHDSAAAEHMLHEVSPKTAEHSGAHDECARIRPARRW